MFTIQQNILMAVRDTDIRSCLSKNTNLSQNFLVVLKAIELGILLM